MRNRLPIVYLVDSAGINLPYQATFSPDSTGRREFSITTL